VFFPFYLLLILFVISEFGHFHPHHWPERKALGRLTDLQISHLPIIDDLAKSRSAPFYSTGEQISSPAIRNEFGHFHPHLRPARKAPRPVDGLFASPSIIEMMNDLFADMVVICHHEKLPNKSFANN